MNHLDALYLRLSNEHKYLAAAKSENEKAIRKVWIAQIKREIEGELKFLDSKYEPIEMTLDEILAELEESYS
jgi:hypothetical protein